ncbi:hypothetical protein [Myroides pelagicus]|uniref:Tetratricopeptide repeat protein n=1 Tax=Myroides pelagicus TaxID=270914 RepID=A0A7K1GJI0_9FLAO|nr:hypothetical protein [Myroides pelagicus]MEC4112773.1 hypothetical protein [Myroides pelagicus]MTH28583.1 hypothetical protein [Myroides pelagicus]
MYRLEIQKILLAIEENFSDPEYCMNLLKQGIQIADKHNDLAWGIDLRYDLIHEERATSSCSESIAAFAWILNICDLYPEEFDESEFMLEYQWMLCSAYSNSLLTLDQINEVAKDLYIRLDRNNLSKRGYYFTMAEFAHNLGDYVTSEEYIAKGVLEAYDDENTEASEYDYRIEHLCLIKDFDQAIRLMDQMEVKKLAAFALPFETYCAMAYTMARANDKRAIIYLNRAKEAFDHLKEVNSSMLYSVVRLTYAMYQLGDEMYLQLYERIAEWEIDAEDDLLYMLSRHMTVIFRKGGTLTLNLSSRLIFYEETGIYDLGQLAVYYEGVAKQLATQFDHRNGSLFASSEYSELLLENTKKD